MRLRAHTLSIHGPGVGWTLPKPVEFQRAMSLVVDEWPKHPPRLMAHET